MGQIKSLVRLERVYAFLFLLPGTVLILLVILWPLVYSFYLSFYQSELLAKTKSFVGLGNYLKVIQDSDMWLTMGNTIHFVFFSLGLGFLLSLGIALLFNEEFKGKSICKGLFLLPWAISPIVGAYMWKWILNPSFGILNNILVYLGWVKTRPIWLGDISTALKWVIATTVWRDLPFTGLLLLAGLQTIPKELYEAAKVDGASGWQQFRFITIPLLKRVAIIALLFETIRLFKTFDIVYLLTGGGPLKTTQVFYFYVYRVIFVYFQIGYGSAIAFILTFLIIIFALVYQRMLGKVREQE